MYNNYIMTTKKNQIPIPPLTDGEFYDISNWILVDDDDDDSELDTAIDTTTTTTAAAGAAVAAIRKGEEDVAAWKVKGSSTTKTTSSTMSTTRTTTKSIDILVDIIIPVYNASTTIRETIHSAMHQIWYTNVSCSSGTSTNTGTQSSTPSLSTQQQQQQQSKAEVNGTEVAAVHAAVVVVPNISIRVCCFNDASTDDSWIVLQELYNEYNNSMQLEEKEGIVQQQQQQQVLIDGQSCCGCGGYRTIPTQLFIQSSPYPVARGPGYARNCAVQMMTSLSSSSSSKPSDGSNHNTNDTTTNTTTRMKYQYFLCWLDSDDIMIPTRIYYQIHTMMVLPPQIRLQTLLGCHFERFVTTTTTNSNEKMAQQDSTTANNNNTNSKNSIEIATPHYTKWANDILSSSNSSNNKNSISNSSDIEQDTNRIYYERFREVTIIQPTWMMLRYRYVHVLNGYIEYPICTTCSSTATSTIESNTDDGDDPDRQSIVFQEWVKKYLSSSSSSSSWRLIHPKNETIQSIRIAEDMRMFYEHFYYNGRIQGTNTNLPLVYYRYRPSVSQSSKTSRKLLLSLRVAAFERLVLQHHNDSYLYHSIWKDKFIVWGAGRDGKDFIKALSETTRERVYCILDVDDNKIARGYYHCNNNDIISIEGKQKQAPLTIPIVHFSMAIKDLTQRMNMYQSWKNGTSHMKATNVDSKDVPTHAFFGRITKNNNVSLSNENLLIDERSPVVPSKKIKIEHHSMKHIGKLDPGTNNIDTSLLVNLPVVVCVAMYRTNGALEKNVELIQRTEGKDLWYFV